MLNKVPKNNIHRDKMGWRKKEGRSDRRQQRKRDKKTRKKGIESVKGRLVKRITEITEGVEWKGEGTEAREYVEISRRRKKS